MSLEIRTSNYRTVLPLLRQYQSEFPEAFDSILAPATAILHPRTTAWESFQNLHATCSVPRIYHPFRRGTPPMAVNTRRDGGWWVTLHSSDVNIPIGCLNLKWEGGPSTNVLSRFYIAPEHRQRNRGLYFLAKVLSTGVTWGNVDYISMITNPVRYPRAARIYELLNLHEVCSTGSITSFFRRELGDKVDNEDVVIYDTNVENHIDTYQEIVGRLDANINAIIQPVSCRDN